MSSPLAKSPSPATRPDQFTTLCMLLSLFVVGSSIPILLYTFSFSTVVAFPILLTSLWLMHHCIRIFRIRNMTIPGLWYWSYLVMIFLPAFYVAAGKPDGSVKNSYLFGVSSVLLTAPLGVLAVSILLRLKPVEIKEYFAAAVKERPPSVHQVIAFSVFLLAAIALTTNYAIEVKNIPFFYLLGNVGAYDEVLSLRATSFKLLSSRLTYVYSVLRQMGYPFLIMVALGNYLKTRRVIWLFLFLVTLCSGFLFAAFSVAKAPVAIIFLTLFLFLYLFFGGAFKAKQLVFSLIIIFAFPVGVILLLQPEVGLRIAVKSTLIRLLDDPARQLYSYFEVVPEYLDYLCGSTISFVARFRGETAFNLTNYVALHDNPSLIARGLTSASANAAFVGDLHANFGVGGVLAGGFLAGFVMQGMQIFLLRQPKTISNLAIYSFVMYGFWFINLSALQTTLLSGGIVFVFMLALLIRIVEAILNISPSDHSISFDRKASA